MAGNNDDTVSKVYGGLGHILIEDGHPQSQKTGVGPAVFGGEGDEDEVIFHAEAGFGNLIFLVEKVITDSPA